MVIVTPLPLLWPDASDEEREQRRHRVRQRVLHRDRAIAGQRWPVLGRLLVPVALFTGQVDQHREPARAFDHGADRRALQSDQEIAFPMPGNGTVLDLGGALADQAPGRHVRPGLAT
jgi:hypothetical protein